MYSIAARTDSRGHPVPTASSNLSLPFAALDSAADAAIASVLHSLRREVSASTTAHLVRLKILQVGFFHAAAGPAAAPVARSSSSSSSSSPVSLPIRLESVYAPALLRRRAPAEDDLAGANLRSSAGGGGAAGSARRKGSEMRKLCKRVWQILVRPNHVGAVGRIGSGCESACPCTFAPVLFFALFSKC